MVRFDSRFQFGENWILQFTSVFAVLPVLQRFTETHQSKQVLKQTPSDFIQKSKTRCRRDQAHLGLYSKLT